MPDQLIPGDVIPVPEDVIIVRGFNIAGATAGAGPLDPEAIPIVILDLYGYVGRSQELKAFRFAMEPSQGTPLARTLSDVCASMEKALVIDTPEDDQRLEEPFGVRFLATADTAGGVPPRYSRGQLGIATHCRRPAIPGQLGVYYVDLGGEAGSVWVLESEVRPDAAAMEALS